MNENSLDKRLLQDDHLPSNEIVTKSINNNQDSNDVITNKMDIMYGYFNLPYSEQTYYCNRGAENIHIYLWITKDLSWTQDWIYPANIFGCLALLWCFVLFYHAIFIMDNYVELYMLIPMTMWLTANFIWMEGEVLNDDDAVVAPITEYVMITAMGLIVIYYIVLKPLKVIPNSEIYRKKFENLKLKPRFSYFKDWREYEYLHALFWLGKDFSWVSDYPIPWVIFLILTLLLSFDFIYATYQSKMMAIDCFHYISQLLWITGNAVWALGELFEIPGNDDDNIYSIWISSETAHSKCRWWASVILFCAYVPIVCLYCIWLPLTYMNIIKAADIPLNDHIITKI